MPQRTSRRDFLQVTAATGIGFWVAGGVQAQESKSPNEKVRIACVGCGGKGSSDSADSGNHGEVVAICDVDEKTLNAAASRVMREFPVHACSDITGFGILGHAFGMASGSGVTLVIESAKLPVLHGAERLAGKGYLTGGCKRNREYLNDKMHIEKSIGSGLVEVALDPMQRVVVAAHPQVGGDVAWHLGVLVVGVKLLPPSVEPEVDEGDPA